jgi:modulator of FtsH protease HflC
MSNRFAPYVIGAVALLILIANTFFTVPQTAQALVLQFGGVERVINAPQQGRAIPGLYVKAPFIQNVVKYDRRNLRADLPGATVIASDQEQLVVDAFARWRIVEPLKFYQAVQTETNAVARLETIMTGSLRRILGASTSNDIISGRRAQLMTQIRDQMNREVAPWGVAIIDVRIRQVDLPQATAERVYERMRTERQQVASQLRAEGDEAAAKIRAEADRAVTVALAEAREISEKTRGDGDAKRAAIFAQAYNRDPEFAGFYRSLQAYEKAIPKGTPMVVPPEGEFFRYMQRGQ